MSTRLDKHICRNVVNWFLILGRLLQLLGSESISGSSFIIFLVFLCCKQYKMTCSFSLSPVLFPELEHDHCNVCSRTGVSHHIDRGEVLSHGAKDVQNSLISYQQSSLTPTCVSHSFYSASNLNFP